jgi:hypothetical protein
LLWLAEKEDEGTQTRLQHTNVPSTVVTSESRNEALFPPPAKPAEPGQAKREREDTGTKTVKDTSRKKEKANRQSKSEGGMACITGAGLWICTLGTSASVSHEFGPLVQVPLVQVPS